MISLAVSYAFPHHLFQATPADHSLGGPAQQQGWQPVVARLGGPTGEWEEGAPVTVNGGAHMFGQQQQQDAAFLQVAMGTPLPPSPGAVGAPTGFPGR